MSERDKENNSMLVKMAATMLNRIKLEKSDRYILKGFLVCIQPRSFSGHDFALWIDGISGYISRLLKGERLLLIDVQRFEPDNEMMKIISRVIQESEENRRFYYHAKLCLSILEKYST